MTHRISTADLDYQMRNLADEFAMIGLRTEGLTLAHGSKTYGRAFRLHYRDSQTGGLSSVPGTRSDFLGMTKAEAYQALKHLIDGIRMTRGALGTPTDAVLTALQRRERACAEGLHGYGCTPSAHV